MATATQSRSAMALARELMDEFAAATGLAGRAPPRRYLWTDAFAVCNFLGLHRESGDGRWLDLALALVDQVHHILGRHRGDDARDGWISGLADDEAERHPTIGGLRIGKPLPERRPGEPFDARGEWDRDGQYFHYLTQWMHALARAAEETELQTFHRWAVELARTAHARFTVRGAQGARSMIWKASIDLSRPLVPSMGQHDPLDAWLTGLELATATQAAPSDRSALERAIEEAGALCEGAQWETDDPLGAGALLHGCVRLIRLRTQQDVDDRGRLLAPLLAAARTSLERCARQPLWVLPAEARLAFRELGLAIGLHGVGHAAANPAMADAFGSTLVALSHHLPLAARIDRFWSSPAHRQCDSWLAHREINAVMLATSLAPDGYLGVG